MINKKISQDCLISVTAGKWQVNSMKEAKRLGCKICAIDTDKNAEGFKIADYSICEKLENIEKIIKKIEKLKIKVKGIVCFNSDAGVRAASLLREHYNLPGIKYSVAKKFTSKHLQKEELLKNNIQTPNFFVISNYSQFSHKVREIGLPFIIKPTDGAGSRGISVINSFNKINLIRCFKKAMRQSKEKIIIIENYIEGVEYVVDVLAIEKKIIALGILEKNKVKNTNNTVAISLKTPDLSKIKQTHIKNFASKAFEVLKLEDSSGHGELIIDKNGKIWMIEVAARGGGFLVFDKLVPIMSGINLPAEVTKLAIGCRSKTLATLNTNVYLRFFPSEKGKIKKIEGFEKLKKFKNIQGASFVSKGDDVEKASTDGDRLGYLFAWGKNKNFLESKINKAKKLIKFTYC